MNKITSFLIAIVVVIISIIIYLLARPLSSAEIFEVKTFNKVAYVCNQDSNICFSCYFIPSNATSQNYIQLRKISGKKETIIANYERYDKVRFLNFESDSVVRLVVENTTAYIKSRDTIDVKF